MREAKVLRYADHFSTVALWWKAILLMPLWAFPLVPLAGAIAGRINEGCVQVMYTFVLGLLLARLVEDILKCKIRIEQDVLFFGYRAYRLNELASAGLLYKENQVLPRQIVLNFRSGRKLKLKISRLRNDDVETLLRYIEATHPDAKIDPVLRTLSKCKKLARNSALDTENAVEIPYASRRVFRQLYDTFMGTAEKWMRVGPLIVAVLASPFWLTLYSQLFTSMNSNSWELLQKVAMKKGLEMLMEGVGTAASQPLAELAKTLATIATNPFVAFFLLVASFITFFSLLRQILRPNVIMLEQDAMRLQLRVLSASLDVGAVGYDSLVNCYLEKPRNSTSVDGWKIVFNRSNGRAPFKLSLGSITPENRIRFIKALERLAPNCSIDAELLEAMMPRQERSYTELWLQSLSAPPERKSLEPLAPAQLLQDERYEVVRKLGVGGQGMAYLSLDKEQNQTVVLKETILPVFVDSAIRQAALERFQQEAELLQKLQHSGVVALQDYFIEDHRGYLVLEHIDGKTLRQLVEEEGALSESKVQDLAVQMCQILSYLHQNGVIHRDFTPDNLILRKDGKLKLIDFNVAQQAQDGATGTIVGKHAFLPPEQFRGKPTFQSDIYAMGATLFLLVTGKDPEPITQSRPSDHGVTISAELEDLIVSATHLSVTKRLPDATTALAKIYAEDGVTISLKQEEKEHISI